ncbi:hypothetical protein MGYG_02451 [Nannizzia gypsea CBS 118893]|uniref:Uncharacterized protein n=1 Tax=Arthroderma gypseum (strain ATCC MYA-4604 / CBS 118893) TaxID=535722 RepID=E4UMM2_ARTGP|nr:hypothetical protein MGYG_02451 [Nannizzia gypsea CBS 118893]EFQ99439.1 hypothetical protein MGYG_02451 [Nannizzia gypsea CBS 118893]
MHLTEIPTEGSGLTILYIGGPDVLPSIIKAVRDLLANINNLTAICVVCKALIAMFTVHASKSGSTEHISNLEMRLLNRDHHRCVVTRKLNKIEAEKRANGDTNIKDDGRKLLHTQCYDNFQLVTVAPKSDGEIRVRMIDSHNIAHAVRAWPLIFTFLYTLDIHKWSNNT